MKRESLHQDHTADRWHPVHTLAVLVLWAAASAVCADSLTLDSGKVLEGKIVSETDHAVQIDVGSMVVTIPRSKIVAATRSATEATTGAAALEHLGSLEAKGLWPDLYEAASDLLLRDPKNLAVTKKRELAESKIRERLGDKKVAALVRERKFDEAIAFLSKQIAQSGLASRGAGAVARRALAELYLASAEARMRTSSDGHVPLLEARKARELDPGTPGLDYTEGMAQMKLRNFKEAIGLLEGAARADPDNFGIRLQLIQCYRETGDSAKIVATYEAAPKKAEASAERWSEVRRMLAEAHVQVALRLADQGTTAQAAAAYDKFLSLSERTPEQLRDAVAFFERVGDFERAKEIRAKRLGGRRSPPARPRQ